MPEGEGTLLEAEVFGVGAGAARLAAADGKVAGGLPEGLAVETEVELFDVLPGARRRLYYPLPA
ncbi:MAG: hypothetical protein C0524_00640 [Rhodobacter sp.]|nr:hypothetical protein [Rhodobacter sp.]